MRGCFPEAVVFDLDGTLIDTEEVWDQIRRGLAVADGIEFPDWATNEMLGMSTPEWSVFLADRIGYKGTPSQIADRVIAAMAERYQEGSLEIPGASEAVRRVAERVPTGIASSSPPQLISAAVEAMGLTDSLSALVSTETVPRGKPAPDGYLRACELLGADPTRCVAVEDSDAGVASALSAGMRVVLVPALFHPPGEETRARSHLVLERIGQLDFETLVGMA